MILAKDWLKGEKGKNFPTGN